MRTLGVRRIFLRLEIPETSGGPNMPFSVKAPISPRSRWALLLDKRTVGRRDEAIRRRRRGRRPAGCEVLEARSLLATISGTVFNDLNANGTQNSGEVGLANVPVYLDVNNNQTLDQASTPTTYNSADTFPIAIPDYSTATPKPIATSTIGVSGVGGIAHMTVTVNITHTWDSDLTATLTNPSGTTITLFGRVGRAGTTSRTRFSTMRPRGRSRGGRRRFRGPISLSSLCRHSRRRMRTGPGR